MHVATNRIDSGLAGYILAWSCRCASSNRSAFEALFSSQCTHAWRVAYRYGSGACFEAALALLCCDKRVTPGCSAAVLFFFRAGAIVVRES